MEALFAKVLDMSLTGSLVILAVLAARYALRKAPKVISYALWAVVLFRLLCPVSVTAPVSVLEVVRPQVTVTSEVTSSITYLPERAPVPQDTQAVPGPEPAERPQSKWDLRDWAAWVWTAGVAAMGFHGLVSYLALRRRLMGAAPWAGRVYLADHIPTPFVMGILGPRIYLPSDTPEGELPFILAHEAHHIRRGDHITRLLAYLALCIHWFNPLVWLAFLLAGKDMEMSCDEAVIRKLGPEIRADYARSLLRLAAGRAIIGGVPLAFGGGDTKGRVKHMARWKKPRPWAVALSAVLCILVVIFCGVNPAVAGSAAEVSDLEKCRLALEEIQNRDSLCATIHRVYQGYDVLNSTSEDTYWRAGENWLKITRIPEDGWKRGYSQHGCLYVDGVYYSNNNYDRVKWDENEDILWSVGGIDASTAPWIARFDWDAQEIRYISTEAEGRGQRITLEFQGPYYDGHNEGTCLMQFVFDSKGDLKRLENEVDTAGLHGITKHRFRFTETIQLRRDDPEGAIQRAYDWYLKNPG